MKNKIIFSFVLVFLIFLSLSIKPSYNYVECDDLKINYDKNMLLNESSNVIFGKITV